MTRKLYCIKGQDADITLYFSADRELVCSDCSLSGMDYVSFRDTRGAKKHLVKHEIAGDFIPARVYGELQEDDDLNFPEDEGWIE